MKNFEVSNTSEKAIAFSLTRQKGDTSITEDYSFYPGEVKICPSLAGSHVKFAYPVDISFRQKKAFTKMSFLSKIEKESYNEVTALDIPDHFVSLKIKRIYI